MHDKLSKLVAHLEAAVDAYEAQVKTSDPYSDPYVALDFERTHTLEDPRAAVFEQFAALDDVSALPWLMDTLHKHPKNPSFEQAIKLSFAHLGVPAKEYIMSLCAVDEDDMDAHISSFQPPKDWYVLGEALLALCDGPKVLSWMLARVGAHVLCTSLRAWLDLGNDPLQERKAWAIHSCGASGTGILLDAHDVAQGTPEMDVGAVLALAYSADKAAATERVCAVFDAYEAHEQRFWVRERCIAALLWLAHPGSILVLERALGMPEHAMSASRALVRLEDLGAKVACRCLERWRDDEELHLRRPDAMRVLVRHASKMTDDALFGLLQDIDAPVRHQAWYALAMRGDVRLFEAMEAVYASRDVFELQEVAAALAEHSDRGAGAVISRALDEARAWSAGEDVEDEIAYQLHVWFDRQQQDVEA